MTREDDHLVLDPEVLDGLRAALEDDELLRDITQSFLTEAPHQVATLASAQQAGDLRAVSTTAHLLKGSALTFGANRLVAVCASLEASPSEARSLLAAVEQACAELHRALIAYLDDLV